MRSELVAAALREQLEATRRGELLRLRKKLNGLTPEAQAAVDAATLAIVDALAARCAALGATDPAMLHSVGELFGVVDRRAADAPRSAVLMAAPTTP